MTVTVYEIVGGGEVVAKKTRAGFPEPEEVCQAVAAATAR